MKVYLTSLLMILGTTTVSAQAGGGSTGYAIMVIIIFVVTLLLIRLFGAWMLRIDEVIKELKKLNKHFDKEY